MHHQIPQRKMLTLSMGFGNWLEYMLCSMRSGLYEEQLEHPSRQMRSSRNGLG